MGGIALAPGEHELMRQSMVSNDDFASLIQLSGELVLTNLNVVWYEKSLLGKVKNKCGYPLASMVYAAATKSLVGSPSLVLDYGAYSVTFVFEGEKKRTPKKWADKINALIEQRDSLQQAQPVAQQAEGTPPASSPHTQQPANTPTAVPVSTTVKCAFCGAPISGQAGRIARCRYCDSEQALGA